MRAKYKQSTDMKRTLGTVWPVSAIASGNSCMYEAAAVRQAAAPTNEWKAATSSGSDVIATWREIP